MTIRRRLQQWFESRIAPRDCVTLTQRNVYILPTSAGWMMAFTLLVLLVASINYQLNLGYVLTFLLTGSTVIGMHVCHGTLRGLTMNLVAPDAHFAGGNIPISVHLVSQRKSVRYSIGLALWGSDHWSWTDVPAQGHSTLQVACTPLPRGLHRIPTLTAETRFPLGTFRVWTVWRPAAQVLVYPAPELHAPPLPAGEPCGGGASAVRRHTTGEFDGVRAYRRGDPLKRVVWKKVAKADELVSRDAQQVHRMELWLDLAHTGSTQSLEHRLSRLCAWVLAAQEQQLSYGLRLAAVEIAPNVGEAHKKACLQALALYAGS
ncbi:MAG: DUF58 domain-containing protein [Burkholderiales bacterium]|nr:DUF58 domain-containing protein [Burkholderiales bacterium]